MTNDPNDTDDDQLVTEHPDNTISTSLFRMSGTSQATAVASGVVALMLEANPGLTPDQVKYRLMVSARPALTEDTEADLVYNILQQGMDAFGLQKLCLAHSIPIITPTTAWTSTLIWRTVLVGWMPTVMVGCR